MPVDFHGPIPLWRNGTKDAAPYTSTYPPFPARVSQDTMLGMDSAAPGHATKKLQYLGVLYPVRVVPSGHWAGRYRQIRFRPAGVEGQITGDQTTTAKAARHATHSNSGAR